MNPDAAAPSAGITTSGVIPKSTVTRPSDPSQYIRTYAKDVAQLTGKNPLPPSASTPTLAKAVEATPPKTRVNFTPTQVPKKELTVEESIDRADLSSKNGMGSIAEDTKPEIFHTSKEDEDIFVPKPAVPDTHSPIVLSPVTASPVVPTPAVRPIQPPPPIIVPQNEIALAQAPKEDSNKESILARLRAKAREYTTPAETLPIVTPHKEINLLKTQSTLADATYTPEPKKQLFTIPPVRTSPAVPARSFTPAPFPKPIVPSPVAPVPTIPLPAAFTPSTQTPPTPPTPVVPSFVPPPVVAPIDFKPPDPPHPPTPVRIPAPIPVPKPFTAPVIIPPVNEQSSSPIHTYSTDFADHIDERRATTFSVLAAQQDNAAPTPLPKPSLGRRPLATFIIAACLIIVGIGLVSGAYYLFSGKSVMPLMVAQAPSLIPYDESVEITGTGADLQSNLAAKANSVILAGNVLLTYVSESTSTEQGAHSVFQPGGVLIQRLNLDAPNILFRNIDQSSTVGVIHAGDQTAPFFILRVNSYERTFAGMLAWEPTMINSLAILYPQYPDPIPVEPVIATTTLESATSSVSHGKATSPKQVQLSVIPAQPAITPGFIDTVVSNRNVREYHDAQGRTVLLYGYIDKQTLVVARDEAAFSALVSRIPSGAVQ